MSIQDVTDATHRTVRRILGKIYGEDQESADDRVEDQEQRIQRRREQRLRVRAEAALNKPTAQDFSDWMGIGNGEERSSDSTSQE